MFRFCWLRARRFSAGAAVRVAAFDLLLIRSESVREVGLQMTGRRLLARLAIVALPLLSLESAARAADDARAKQTFAMCTMCHGPHGEGDEITGAPSIAGLPEWYVQGQLEKFQKGWRAYSPKDYNGLKMRPMARHLVGDDLAMISKYVAALPRPITPDTIEGNIVKGEGAYAVCKACHGPDGMGNQQLGAPPLAHGSDWYLLTQLQHFKAGIRGGKPTEDPIGATMQGIATGLDEESMKNVLAYLNVLESDEPAQAAAPAK
jgi:cytochrome c oxidase subunit 2